MEQQGRVLIVDDNAMNVDVLRRILRKDYELESAADGDECLQKLAAFKPQLVLLDIMMPGIDGYETCRRIKASELGEAVQVILVSGKGTPADRVHGYESQADDYIVKPFNHEELLSKVRVHFRQLNAQKVLDRREASEALVRLCRLVNQMSTDINEHTHLIHEIQRELNAVGAEGPDALIRAMVRLADTNRATQSRLAAAERKLRDEAQEIAAHASEARTDALTLLPNRRAFDEELARRVAEAKRAGGGRLCAAMIDVDHFKDLNDRFGHPAGDEVLQAIGRLLGRTIRQMDLAARYGGDEFAAILPASSFEDAQAAAKRIQEAIDKSPVLFDDRELHITASVGVAEWTPGEDGPSLMKRADEAMYASKRANRNCVHWHDGEQSHPVGQRDAVGAPVMQREQAAGDAASLLRTG